jgi:hypothetical protein
MVNLKYGIVNHASTNFTPNAVHAVPLFFCAAAFDVADGADVLSQTGVTFTSSSQRRTGKTIAHLPNPTLSLPPNQALGQPRITNATGYQ